MFASMVIFNSENSELDDMRVDSASFIAYLALFGEPFIIAFGMVLMRSLRELNNMTVNTYTNLSAIFILFIWVISSGKDIYAYKAFGVYDWLVLSACSILVAISETLKFITI